VLHDLRGALGANEVPSSVITGTHDILTPPRHGRILAEALGRAEFHLLDGIGHQVMQEDPFVLAEHIRAHAGGPAANPVGAGAAHPGSGTGGDGGPDVPGG
jgi:pimeloyl-ACP methyl ester carboxylesterase